MKATPWKMRCFLATSILGWMFSKRRGCSPDHFLRLMDFLQENGLFPKPLHPSDGSSPRTCTAPQTTSALEWISSKRMGCSQSTSALEWIFSKRMDCPPTTSPFAGMFSKRMEFSLIVRFSQYTGIPTLQFFDHSVFFGAHNCFLLSVLLLCQVCKMNQSSPLMQFLHPGHHIRCIWV